MNYDKKIENNPVPNKLIDSIRPKVTFMCDKNQYEINELEQFTKNTDAVVIIRGYGRVEDGRLILNA